MTAWSMDRALKGYRVEDFAGEIHYAPTPVIEHAHRVKIADHEITPGHDGAVHTREVPKRFRVTFDNPDGNRISEYGNSPQEALHGWAVQMRIIVRVMYRPDDETVNDCIATARGEERVRATADHANTTRDLIFTCPSCGERHIDEGEFATKAHHTHACQHCGMVWRPGIGATRGVRFLPGYKNEPST